MTARARGEQNRMPYVASEWSPPVSFKSLCRGSLDAIRCAAGFPEPCLRVLHYGGELGWISLWPSAAFADADRNSQRPRHWQVLLCRFCPEMLSWVRQLRQRQAQAPLQAPLCDVFWACKPLRRFKGRLALRGAQSSEPAPTSAFGGHAMPCAVFAMKTSQIKMLCTTSEHGRKRRLGCLCCCPAAAEGGPQRQEAGC